MGYASDPTFAPFLAEHARQPLLQELVALLQEGISEARLWDRLGTALPGEQLAIWYGQLVRHRLIFFTWSRRGEPLLTIELTGPRFQWRARSGASILSRFAYLRRAEPGWVLESPLTDARITGLAPEVGRWLLSLDATGAVLPEDPPDPSFVELLDQAGFLQNPMEPPDTRFWEFHDRLFHDFSTYNRPDEPFGSTCRFAGKFPYPGTRRAPSVPPELPLSAFSASRSDASLAETLARRRSLRVHGEVPVSLDQLAALLNLALRVTGPRPPDQTLAPSPVEASIPACCKPYPGAGGIHELRTYVIVHRCAGLAPGLYRYDDEAHGLTRLPKSSAYSELAIHGAACYWGNPARKPQVVLLLTSRLDLLAWKYEKIAYRLTLLNAGCAAQTVSLAATSLGLACCVLGGINGMLFRFLESLGELEGTPLIKIAIGSPCRPGDPPYPF